MSTDPAEEAAEDLAVRRAGPEDTGGLAALHVAARRAAAPAMPPMGHSEAETRDWFHALLAGDGREVWVAEQGGEPVGYLVLDAEWLDSLYVRPDLTGGGIGSVLMDLAKSLRPGGFGLWVFQSNRRAREFYRRHGLVEVERTDGSANEERAPDVHLSWPGPVARLRARIDEVDDRLADLLEERARLTAQVQRRKPVPGHAGRDPEREEEIAARMGARAPRLGPERIARIMEVVISVSLDAAAAPDSRPDPGPDPGADPGAQASGTVGGRCQDHS